MRRLAVDPLVKIAFRILAPALVPVIADNGYKMPPDKGGYIGICIVEHTVRHAVISGTAKGIPIHFPQVNRLAETRRLDACIPELGPPGDRPPRAFFRGGLHQGVEGIKFLGLDGLKREQHLAAASDHEQGSFQHPLSPVGSIASFERIINVDGPDSGHRAFRQEEAFCDVFRSTCTRMGLVWPGE
jgi:hypothetical protein